MLQMDGNMNVQQILSAAALAGVLLLAACTTAPTLDDTNWQLVSLDGVQAPGDSQITLQLRAGRVSGRDGCNHYSGTYTQNGNQIRFNDDIASTEMACSDPIMQRADSYMQALRKAASHRRDDDQLVLLDAQGAALATFMAPQTDVTGTAWIVTGYNNGKQAVTSVITDSELTLVFGADGTLNGSAGCNNYSATYTLGDKTLKVGPAATTRKMCASPEGVMEQEMQFLKALETAATFDLVGDRLELRSADGAIAITLERA